MMFDKFKVINVILYVIDKYGEKTDMHKLFKTLYFADQEHLSKYGRTITKDTYIAMQFGPVPSKIDDILKAVRGDSFFEAGDLTDYFEFINHYIVKSKKKCNTDYLSKSDIECLDNSISICRDKSFEELTMLSHGYAWNSTAKGASMDYADILAEDGDSEEYIDYIKGKMFLEKLFC